MALKYLLYSFLLDSGEILAYVIPGTKIVRGRNTNIGDTAEIHIARSVTAVKTPSKGQSIIISRGESTATEKYIFRGIVKRIETEQDIYIITCRNTSNKMKFDPFTKSYDKNIDSEGGEVSAIASDIVTDGGLTPNAVSSGTGTSDIVLDKFISKRQTRLNRLNVLVRILNWFWYEDYDSEEIKIQPKGNDTFGTTLTVGSNVVNQPIWNEDLESMRNKITVEGAFDEDTRKETETGDATEDTFSFTNTPYITDCTVDGVLQKKGVLGSTETFDYSVDSENKTYTFESGSIPGIGAAIIMSYTTLIPRPVIAISDTSIAQYQLTQHEVYKFDDVKTINDAEIRATQLVNLLKDGFDNTTIFTTEYLIKPGMLVSVIDSLNPTKSDTYTVFKITTNYPDPFDVIEIGDEEFNVSELFLSIEERIKTLEEKDTGFEELLRQIFTLQKSIGLSRDSFTKTVQKICDTFTSDNLVNNKVGMGKLLTGFNSDVGNWSAVGGALSDEASIKLVGAGSLKIIMSSDSLNLGSSQDYGDVSAYTGVASGTPSQGTCGIWVYITTPTKITDINLQLGSFNDAYAAYTAKAYASVDGYHNWDSLTFTMQSGWNYFLFDLDDPDSVTGTPDWTNCDFTRFTITTNNNPTFYLDYFTISKSNYIGLNGAGVRKMVIA